jgi:phage baseplate assembly protein gpV
MLRFGIISEVDADKGQARVKFDGEDGIVSYWLPISVPKTKEDKYSIPFDVNEHVWCLMDDNLEYGVIGGAIYDTGNGPIGGADGKVAVKFTGSLRVEFDRNSKSLSINGPGDLDIDINGTGTGKVNIRCNQATIESLTGIVEVIAPQGVLFTSPTVTVTGQLIAASIAITGSGAITGAGSISVSGTITGGQVMEGTIRLGTHKHTGVTVGGGITGTPTP